MIRRLPAAVLVAILGASTAAPTAQWPPFPTPSVPRTADGRPESARHRRPARPTADPISPAYGGTPAGPRSAAGSGVSGTGGAPGTPAVLPRGPGLFFNIGSGVPGGLPFQPWAAELLKKRMADNSKDNPDAHCLPIGDMQLHTHPQPRKIIQTPDVIVILYEANGGVRQIFTGRPAAAGQRPAAVVVRLFDGPWVGDTLVVETSGFRDGGWLDVNGSPLTDAARLTERFRG